MKKFIIYLAGCLGVITLCIGVFLYILFQDIEFGGEPLAESTALLSKSPNFKDGQFRNKLKERKEDLWVSLKEFSGDQQRRPPALFPQVKPRYDDKPFEGLRAVWFGHASVLVEIEGHRVFFDPMLSEQAFLLKAIAPTRMNPPPLKLEELPKIDAVIISHDHYDHLDMKTVQYLHNQGATFFVGLGIGAHLRKWGISEDRIHEMDWGDTVSLKGLTINCTEARHYSGRKSRSQDTLWASWVVKGDSYSVFHSGDTGYSEHFKNIALKFPNIDLALIKVGDYGMDFAWQDIHMIPENSVQAYMDLGAKLMLPIHWGVFELSFHPWNEPIERTLTAAKKHNIQLVTPKLGEMVEVGQPIQNELWWRLIK